MNTELEILEQYDSSTGTYFSDRREHTEVTVAIVYWDRGDLQIQGEIQRLRKVFEIDYGYHVLDDFVIPFGASAQQDLGSYLASFVQERSNRSNTLIIVYYAGHCYYTADGRDARWFARKDSSYSLSWTTCGHCLFGAIGDVLIILDCCEAAVKLTGTKEQGRFELLAATARGLPTPDPGMLSFTSFLIKELRRRKSEGITARELSSLIWRQDMITQTPHWDDFALKRLESILLRPLHLELQVNTTQEDKESGLTLLSVSHDGQLTGYQLAEYLKTGLPASITAINIEALILRAKVLQEDSRLRAFPEGSLLHSLSDASKSDILRQVQGLDIAMQKTSNDAQTSVEAQKKESAKENLHSIHNAVSSVSTAIETPLLLGHDKYELLQAFRNQSKPTKSIGEMMALREKLLESTVNLPARKLEIPRQIIDFKSDEERFCRATCRSKHLSEDKGGEKETGILIEFLPPYAHSEPPSALLQQLEHIAELLHLDKPIEFRTLSCSGYFHDQIRHRFGFVFEKHNQADITELPVALSELYKDPKYRFVSLDERLGLAHTLALAVDHFHRIGWVHKELRSNNIFMLEKPKSTSASANTDEKLDVSMAQSLHGLRPWIFGFGFARSVEGSTALEEDYHVENNMYRHPHRVGRPLKRFTRAYDVYALGVILFEIALWKKIKPPSSSSGRVQSQDVYKYIMQPQQRIELAFRAGTAFSSAIVTCLDFDTLTEGLSELEEHTYFQQRVVGILRKASESLPGYV